MAGFQFSWMWPHRGGPRQLAGIVLLCFFAAWLWQLDVGTREPATLAVSAQRTRSAVEVQPRTQQELDRILGLSRDVWSERVSFKRPIVVVVDQRGLDGLASLGVSHRVIVEDIDRAADDERRRLAVRVRGETGDWFSEYRDVEELSEYIDGLGRRFPAVAKPTQIGTSIEGRPIRALEISRGGDIAIVLNGGHHAREWISVMVPMCIADRLLGENDGERVRRILESVSFYVVPLVNPDGYHYSWTFNRYWRKNRRGDHGVDLNRNYSVGWGGKGSSSDRRSQNYRGERAFSEPETQAMRDLFESESIDAHIDFHSYSQLILYPWAHKRAKPTDADKFAAIADRMTTAIYAEHGEMYRVIPGSELGIGAAGTFGDWAYGEGGALSLLIELRPSGGGGGFVLPPEQIVPTCEENLAAVLELAEWMIHHHERGQRGETD